MSIPNCRLVRLVTVALVLSAAILQVDACRRKANYHGCQLYNAADSYEHKINHNPVDKLWFKCWNVHNECTVKLFASVLNDHGSKLRTYKLACKHKTDSGRLIDVSGAHKIKVVNLGGRCGDWVSSWFE